MNSQLIVHHPYRTLLDLQGTLSLTQEETTLAWSVINDHYFTDLPLLYPPHVIAITAIFLGIVLKPSQPGLHSANSSAAVATAAQAALKSANASSGTSQSNSMSSGSDINKAGPQNKVQMLIGWLAEGGVDVEAMIDCTQEIISLYEVWDQFNEKVCKEQIARFVKARGIDK
jgi:cyclin C